MTMRYVSATSEVNPILAARMAFRRIRFRPPGVKPWTRIGRFGAVRGRLGLAWVVAPLVVGIALVLAGWFLLRG